MLKQFHYNKRHAKIITQAVAQSQVSSDWNDKSDSLERTFEFINYEHASNFLQRYNDMCEKLNQTPNWANVYNRVSVTLQNTEFSEITKTEVSLANYLDTLKQVSDSFDDRIYEDINSSYGVYLEQSRNDQNEPTLISYKSQPQLE